VRERRKSGILFRAKIDRLWTMAKSHYVKASERSIYEMVAAGLGFSLTISLGFRSSTLIRKRARVRAGFRRAADDRHPTYNISRSLVS